MSHQDLIFKFLSFLFLVCPIVCVRVKTYRKCMVGKNWPKAFIRDRTTRDFLRQGGGEIHLESTWLPRRCSQVLVCQPFANVTVL